MDTREQQQQQTASSSRPPFVVPAHAGGDALHAKVLVQRDREVHGQGVRGDDRQVRAGTRRPRRHEATSPGTGGHNANLLRWSYRFTAFVSSRAEMKQCLLPARSLFVSCALPSPLFFG